jgi:hypothetical protein
VLRKTIVFIINGNMRLHIGTLSGYVSKKSVRGN